MKKIVHVDDRVPESLRGCRIGGGHTFADFSEKGLPLPSVNFGGIPEDVREKFYEAVRPTQRLKLSRDVRPEFEGERMADIAIFWFDGWVFAKAHVMNSIVMQQYIDMVEACKLTPKPLRATWGATKTIFEVSGEKHQVYTLLTTEGEEVEA